MSDSPEYVWVVSDAWDEAHVTRANDVLQGAQRLPGATIYVFSPRDYVRREWGKAPLPGIYLRTQKGPESPAVLVREAPPDVVRACVAICDYHGYELEMHPCGEVSSRGGSCSFEHGHGGPCEFDD